MQEPILMSIDMKQTGANIRRLAKEHGYSVHEIMALTGVGAQQTIYKWYSGRSLPVIETMLVLCYLFGVSVNDLLVTNTMHGQYHLRN